MLAQGDVARSAAVELMTRVTEHGHLLSADLPNSIAKLAPEQRARAQRLATEALRWSQRADRLLGPHLRLRPEDHTMNALRLALYEINEAGTPVHAAVHAAVSIVTRSKSGLVNGVLRNVQRRGTDWADLPLPSLPKWLRKPLVAAYGKDVVAAIEAEHAKGAPLDLTLKDPAKASELAEQLGATVLSTGSLRLEQHGQVSALPGFDAGDWWVQDAAAAIPARLLQVQRGERVLDVCAAPGGKTLQLAAAGAEVTALDVSDRRLERLRENLKRTGLPAEIVVADALEWKHDGAFDAILVDAPCTATGTLRRHPDLAYAKDGTTVADLATLQRALLERCLGWLKPGGRLVFCTCSLLPQEGEDHLKAVDAGLSVEVPTLDWLPAEWRTTDGKALRIRPDHWAETGGLDGFFVTMLRKQS